MHLSAHELVMLPIDRDLAEHLEVQLGNDFGSHIEIISPLSAVIPIA